MNSNSILCQAYDEKHGDFHEEHGSKKGGSHKKGHKKGYHEEGEKGKKGHGKKGHHHKGESGNFHYPRFNDIQFGLFNQFSCFIAGHKGEKEHEEHYGMHKKRLIN